MAAVIVKIDIMPMLAVRDAEDKINHLCTALLHLLHGFRGCWMDAILAWLIASLRKHTRSVREGISNGSTELPEYLSKSLLELLVDDHMLIDTKASEWQFGEIRDVQPVVVLPIK